jgi:hypothetical protein
MPKADLSVNYAANEEIDAQSRMLNYRDHFSYDMKNRNLLSEEELREMKKIFSCLDLSANFRVDRYRYVTALRQELREGMISKPAVYIGIIDKFLPLGKILNLVEQDGLEGEEFKEVISWEKFKSYFTNFTYRTAIDRFDYYRHRAILLKETDL